MNNWKPISDLPVEALGHYWVYDTNEKVVEAYWDPDHRIMKMVCLYFPESKPLFAVTHFKEYQVPDDPLTEDRKRKLKKLAIE